MRTPNILRRSAVILATVAGLTLATAGVSDAAVSNLLIGNYQGSSRAQCVGVILDVDGVYNHIVAGVVGGPVIGYDAVVCSPGGAGLTNVRDALGWNHVGGYYAGPGACENEYTWDGVSTHATVFQREFCGNVNNGSVRAISTASPFFLIFRVR